MTSPLEDFPPELFRCILAYLSPEDTSALAQTCHRMNIITRDEKIWRQYFLKRYMIIIFQRDCRVNLKLRLSIKC
jgi:hypothetical protein